MGINLIIILYIHFACTIQLDAIKKSVEKEVQVDNSKVLFIQTHCIQGKCQFSNYT